MVRLRDTKKSSTVIASSAKLSLICLASDSESLFALDTGLVEIKVDFRSGSSTVASNTNTIAH